MQIQINFKILLNFHQTWRTRWNFMRLLACLSWDRHLVLTNKRFSVTLRENELCPKLKPNCQLSTWAVNCQGSFCSKNIQIYVKKYILILAFPKLHFLTCNDRFFRVNKYLPTRMQQRNVSQTETSLFCTHTSKFWVILAQFYNGK